MVINCAMANPETTLTLHRYKHRNQAYRERLPGGVELIMMRIPAGEFMMGAPEDEPDSVDIERPQHQVRVAEFFMGQTPVTQAQWRAVVENSEPITRELTPDPAKFKGDRRPVDQVSWIAQIQLLMR
jgi:formylglycine-generating enzyme required for sulfatase activity